MIFGYGSVALATLGIALVSFGVSARHMFAVGMSPTLDLLFAARSYLIAVPTASRCSIGTPRCTAENSG